MEDLARMIGTFVADGSRAAELRAVFVHEVLRIARHYPPAYFETGERTDENVESLADRVFTVCARVPKGRFPYLGREPFRAFVEEGFDDPPIRYHAFSSRLSLTRELLRDDYAFRIRREPILAWRDEVWRRVGRSLTAGAERAGAHWRIPPVGPTPLRSDEDVRSFLRELRGASVEDLALAALRRAGRPLRQAEVADLVASVLDPPAAAPLPEGPGLCPAERRAVRAAVATAWEGIDDDERALLLAVVRGTPYDDLIAARPSLRDRPPVRRAIRRLATVFLGAVARAAGAEAAPPECPRAVLEAVAECLSPYLPEAP